MYLCTYLRTYSSIPLKARSFEYWVLGVYFNILARRCPHKWITSLRRWCPSRTKRTCLQRLILCVEDVLLCSFTFSLFSSSKTQGTMQWSRSVHYWEQGQAHRVLDASKHCSQGQEETDGMSRSFHVIQRFLFRQKKRYPIKNLFPCPIPSARQKLRHLWIWYC